MSEPRMWERCVAVLAALGGEASAVQVRDVLIGEGEPPSRLDAAWWLRYAARKSPPLAEVTGRTPAYSPVYRLTAAGRAWADDSKSGGA